MVLNDGTVQLSSLGKYGAQLSPLFLIHMLYVSVSIWACFRVCSQPAMRGAPPEVRLGWHLFKKCCHTEQSGLKQCYTVTALHTYSTEIEKKLNWLALLTMNIIARSFIELSTYWLICSCPLPFFLSASPLFFFFPAPPPSFPLLGTWVKSFWTVSSC